MSAHALLAMHNLSVLDAFFAGVRSVLGGVDGRTEFVREVGRFGDVYEGGMVLFEEARMNWADVDRARGKGRLAREKAKQLDLNDVVGAII